MNKTLRHAMTTVIIAALILTPVTIVATGVLPWTAYIVQTPSMSPMIPPASLVIVEKDAPYDVGQVITFRKGSTLVTHRLTALNADGTLTTKGDANDTVDPSTTERSDVVGGVVASLPTVGLWVVYLQNPLTIASIFIGALVIFFLCGGLQRREKPVAAETLVAELR